jgi:hypothetical protein
VNPEVLSNLDSQGKLTWGEKFMDALRDADRVKVRPGLTPGELSVTRPGFFERGSLRVKKVSGGLFQIETDSRPIGDRSRQTFDQLRRSGEAFVLGDSELSK